MTTAREDDGVIDDGFTRLAAMVVKQAIHDRHLTGHHGLSARRFLDGSDGLSWWCEVAQVDVSVVVDRIDDADRSGGQTA